MLTSSVGVFVTTLNNGETHGRLLTKLRMAVEERAHQLVHGATPRMPAAFHDRLMQEAEVIDMDGWNPLFGMIDRDDTIRIGLHDAFPGIPIRMCQYHLIKDIRIQLRSYYGGDEDGRKLIEKALAAFRRCQRVTKPEDFDNYYAELRTAIIGLGPDRTKGEANWVALDRYLHITGAWFHERWRDACLDYGIPAGLLRDNYLSTNNATERAFCTFDRTFLCARANKRWASLLFGAATTSCDAVANVRTQTAVHRLTFQDRSAAHDYT